MGVKKKFGFHDKYDEAVTTLVEKEIKFEQSLRITNWDRPSDTKVYKHEKRGWRELIHPLFYN